MLDSGMQALLSQCRDLGLYGEDGGEVIQVEGGQVGREQEWGKVSILEVDPSSVHGQPSSSGLLRFAPLTSVVQIRAAALGLLQSYAGLRGNFFSLTSI